MRLSPFNWRLFEGRFWNQNSQIFDMSLFLEIVTFHLCFETKSLQSYRSYFLAICHLCIIFVEKLFRLKTYFFDFSIIETFCYHRAHQDFQLLNFGFTMVWFTLRQVIFSGTSWSVLISHANHMIPGYRVKWYRLCLFVVVKQRIFVQYFKMGRKCFNRFCFFLCGVNLVIRVNLNFQIVLVAVWFL